MAWTAKIKGGETITELEVRHANGLTSDDHLQDQNKRWPKSPDTVLPSRSHMMMFARSLSHESMESVQNLKSEDPTKKDQLLCNLCGLNPSATQAWVINKHRKFYHENPFGWYNSRNLTYF